MLRDWRTISERVAEAARRVLGDVQVVVFGSILGSFTASSDIDILVVASVLPSGLAERAELKRAVEEEAGLPPINPVQIHLATKKEAESYPIYLEALREGKAL